MLAKKDPQQNKDDLSQWRTFQKIRTSPTKKIGRRLKKIESSTLKHAHRFIVRRWENILDVRRNIIGWLSLMVLLIGLISWQSLAFAGQYQVNAADARGSFSEGVVGRLDTVNPLFARSIAERSAVRLIFSSLLQYDEYNRLSGDLAQSWRYEEDGKQIVVSLKPNLTWHDGAPLTAEDVVFTTNLIKNTNVDSPLISSWQGVSVQAVDQRTIKFILPSVNAQFIDSLTVGILPKHLLSKIDVSQLKVASFNRAPVGSGPFEFRNISQQANNEHTILSLSANTNYYSKQPIISSFYLHAFATPSQLAAAYARDEVNAAANLDIASIRSLSADKQASVADSPLNDGTYAFMKTDSEVLKDLKVREALRLATNRSEIIKQLDNRVMALNGPIIPSQLSKETFASLPKQPAFNAAEAEKILDGAGWAKGENGIRKKGDQELALSLVTVRTNDFPEVAERLAKGWNAIGAKVTIRYVELDKLRTEVIDPRAYDIFLYEIALGRDMDSYAYWSSTQAVPNGFNLSNYKSDIADDSLLTGRSRIDPELREVKYALFYKQWMGDVPAVALYQPTLHYASSSNTNALQPNRPIIDAIDRYAGVEFWSASEATHFRTP